MKKQLLAFASLVFISLMANAQKVAFEEFNLDNGLHVILHQDNTAPVVSVGVMYNVGGKIWVETIIQNELVLPISLNIYYLKELKI